MKAVIVDDERLPAGYLEELIAKHCPEIDHVSIQDDPVSAISHLNTHKVDLLFLDVEMPQMNGFDLLRCIHESHMPKVIFTSAHEHYALKAFDMAALHYLLKPVEPAKLVEAVRRATDDNGQSKAIKKVLAEQESVNSQKEVISLPDGQRYHLVAPEEIVRVEGKGSYSTFFLVDGRSIMVSKRIRVYADQLGSELFIRSHQSHLVNKKMVIQFNKSEGGSLELRDGSIVPVSISSRKKVKDEFGL